jgi:beta-N-acetylhexosaminidase
MKFIRTVILSILIASIMTIPVQAERSTRASQMQAVLDSMSPEERVGQLFLVTFNGTDTSLTSRIYDLIVRYHVGGVVLLAANDNFTAAPDTIPQANLLIQNLQTLNWESSVNPEADPVSGQIPDTTYVPLFVGLAQEGNGHPTDQILNGLTPLPSEMSIGATWNPEFARLVGEVQGRELAALGFNLYIGPSLDVLETPAVAGGDLGTRVFGGDPFWVGEMGRAYISGLHVGSRDRLVLIAKHFPGVGGSDRLPGEEVSTVRKSLEQLKQIELAPFFAVTGNASTPEQSVDGLLVSHIRYQGFQGNIRATTRPVSFDAQALGQILALPQFMAWRDAGGLVVSDDLGTRSVREFYAQGGTAFSARFAARDAFLAGNDMLYLGNVISSDTADTYATTIRVLDFFAQKYREDPAFAQRVDASVTRILAVKFGLYENFTLPNVLVRENYLDEIGNSGDLVFDIARNSATLISPDLADFATVLPNPPQPDEQLVFITDTTSVRQCSFCVEQPTIAVDALQQAVLQLYGPQSGNQTTGFSLASYTFQNLQSLLNKQDVPFMEGDINRADWVVISIADSSQGQPALIRRFLTERPELLQDTRVIVFSFDAPYYFDATDISKFTAYFSLYSKQPEFVNVAARLLFQELTPIGASPVTISGVGYDLISVMTPAPDQIIPLFLDLPSDPPASETVSTLEATPVPLFQIGDTIAIRTGVIVDHNGHAVPDGTVVQFSMMLTGDSGGILEQVDAVTTQGVARASFKLESPGLLEIRAVSEPAAISQVLQLDVSETGPVAVTVVVPQLTQSNAPTPIPSVVPNGNSYISEDGSPRFLAWFMAMLFIALSVSVGYFSAIRLSDPRAALRWSLGILIGGLFAYNYLALGLFGIFNWLTFSGLGGVLLIVFIGELLGLAGGWAWSRR